jgi:membrane protein
LNKITQQISYFLDPSAVQVVQNIAQKASHPGKGLLATIIGVALALFGASGVFGQLQDALNTIWGIKPKPGGGIWSFLRSRFLSFAMVGGICFLLLVSLTLESMLKAFSPLYPIPFAGRHCDCDDHLSNIRSWGDHCTFRNHV